MVALRVVAERRTRRPLRVEISDPGVGIPPDRLDSIFEPFEQADNSNTRRYEGAGIGLSICQALSRLMGYRLRATSEPGRGSTFTLLL
jgi:signal transduction histidine kinase